MNKIVLILVIGIVITTIHSTIVAQVPQEQTAKVTDLTKDELTDAATAMEDLKKAQIDFVLDYQKFRKSADTKFTSNEIRIDDLKIEIFSMNVKDNSAIYQKEVSDFAHKNSSLKKELIGYTDEGPAEWTAYKTEFNRDMDELRKALKNFTINTK